MAGRTMFNSIAFLLLLIPHLVTCQKSSPCPEIFSYEPRGQEEDRWYGVIALQTREELDGVWLKIGLDRPAELLGNWFGEADSRDNQEFTVKNPRYRLEAGPAVSVRFFVKYNGASTVPSLTSIKLNGKTICSTRTDATETATPKLHISHVRPSNQPASGGREQEGSGEDTRRTSSHNQQQSSGSTGSRSTRRPSSSRQTTSRPSTHRQTEDPDSSMHYNGLSVDEDASHNDSQFFPGDFALNRPSQSRPVSRPSSPNRQNVACGTVAAKPSPLISYGQNTSQGQWPWHAALYHANGAQLIYTCGATLISEYHLVTAAHCVAVLQTTRPIDKKRLAVYLGKYSLKKFGSGTQDREVDKIYIHPDYNYTVYYNDIAVLKLKTPADYTNYVRPCCLWEENTNIESVLDKLGTVVGWGFDKNRQISDTLMQASMPVVSMLECIYSNRDFFSQFTFEKTYCAGFRNGTTVCNGDSGGGMVFRKSGDSAWQIRGIVSVSVALQGQGVCDPRQYIVFTDVAKHLDWLKQTMKE